MQHKVTQRNTPLRYNNVKQYSKGVVKIFKFIFMFRWKFSSVSSCEEFWKPVKIWRIVYYFSVYFYIVLHCFFVLHFIFDLNFNHFNFSLGYWVFTDYVDCVLLYTMYCSNPAFGCKILINFLSYLILFCVQNWHYAFVRHRCERISLILEFSAEAKTLNNVVWCGWCRPTLKIFFSRWKGCRNTRKVLTLRCKVEKTADPLSSPRLHQVCFCFFFIRSGGHRGLACVQPSRVRKVRGSDGGRLAWPWPSGKTEDVALGGASL